MTKHWKWIAGLVAALALLYWWKKKANTIPAPAPASFPYTKIVRGIPDPSQVLTTGMVGKWKGAVAGSIATLTEPITTSDAGWLFDTYPGLTSVTDSTGTVYTPR